MLRDLVVMLADGGDCLADLGALRDQEDLFGGVASDSTAFRVIDSIDAECLERLRAGVAVARSRAWRLGARPARTVLDVDATLTTAHSEKEQAAGNFKGGYGHHPLLCYLDSSGEGLAGVLRPGNAGSNTAADHIAVLDLALEQLDPQALAAEILVRVDGAGASHEVTRYRRDGAGPVRRTSSPFEMCGRTLNRVGQERPAVKVVESEGSAVGRTLEEWGASPRVRRLHGREGRFGPRRRLRSGRGHRQGSGVPRDLRGLATGWSSPPSAVEANAPATGRPRNRVLRGGTMHLGLKAIAGAALASMFLAAPAFAGEQRSPATTKKQARAFQAVPAQADGGAPETFAPCVRGLAAGTYPCHRIDMMSHLSLEDLGLSFGNDMWGWTDPQTGRDYALMGGTEGTAIVDITRPKRPDVVGILPAHALDPQRPFWRDIKVFDNHMYVVSEQLGHGLQVFDLTEVRGVTGDPVTFSETAHYAGFSTAHNVAINEDTGFLYAVGARNLDRSLSCGGGLHMVDINDPTNPTFAGCFAEHGYIHDTQCVIYEGPDPDYQGREICFNSNAADDGNFVSIVDVTDKSNPVPLARVSYPNDGYSHQGWLTADQAYFLHGDELDELEHGIGTTTRVWDVSDLDAPVLIGVFENDTTSIDHNLYTEGRFAFASNYTSGLRVYDLGRVSDGILSEVAFFDVYPENDNASFEGGTWSNYPYFRQKRIVGVSSIDRGLFILRPRGSVGV